MLIILMGKSAVGKDTVQKELANCGIEKVVTATTRPMREGEQNGTDYHFLSDTDFNNLIDSNGFVEHTSFNGVQYGCPKSSVDLNKSQCIILEPEGVQNFINAFGRENIFVVSLELDDNVRKLRAECRGSFSESKWQKRCESDSKRFSEETVDDLANFRMNLSDYMYRGINPKETAKELMQAVAAYEKRDRLPDEKYTVSYSDLGRGYFALDEAETDYTKHEFDDLPFC